MADAHTTSLQYLGKYVSFLTASAFEMKGVISSVIFNMDGTVEFSLGWGEFYSFIEVRNLKIVEMFIFFDFPWYIYEIQVILEA